jgi:hypothetical protein
MLLMGAHRFPALFRGHRKARWGRLPADLFLYLGSSGGGGGRFAQDKHPGLQQRQVVFADRQGAVGAVSGMVVEGPEPAQGNDEGPVDPAEVGWGKDFFEVFQGYERQQGPVRHVELAVIFAGFDVLDVGDGDLFVPAARADEEKRIGHGRWRRRNSKRVSRQHDRCIDRVKRNWHGSGRGGPG